MLRMWPLALYWIYTHVLSPVLAQTTNTVCNNNSTTSFSFNEAGESPCQTWSKLQSLCIPDSAFVNVPPLVDVTYGYNPPGTTGTACQCNIAAYNLMAACSWCQVGGESTWSTQETYSAGCTTFIEDGLGFSQNSVALPPFVWRTWDNVRFDPALAAAAAPSFATTSPASGPTTLSRPFPVSQSTIISSSTAAPPSSSSTDTKLTGAPAATDSPSLEHGHENQNTGTPWAIILGSIGGAIAAAIILAMLIFFIVLRRKKRNAQAQKESTGDSVDGPTAGTERRFDPSYHTSTDWKLKHRSFLEVLANPTGPKEREKRATGESFFSPRTPPRPFALANQQSQRQRKDSNDSIESLRYTTTSERLQRDRTGSISSGSEVSFGMGVGPPKVGMRYIKAKDVTNISVVSPMTARTDMTSTHRGPGGLLEAVNAMKKEDGDDPLETPSTIAPHTSDGYPFPPPPPINEKPLPRPPVLKSRLSTKIPDSRFSSAVSMAPPPVTPAHDFTLPPEEYRRKQSRQFSNPDVPRGSSALPSLYEPLPGATRYLISQRTDYSKNSRRISRGLMSDDGESLIFSATPSSDSRYPSFIPDAQTVQRVKGMFGLSNLQFPLPPSTARVRRKSGGSASGSEGGMSPREWGKAKSKAKLTQEVMNIGKKDPIVERGNENGLRKGSV